MKLKNGYDIQGRPTLATYHRNECGLYTIDIYYYSVTKPDGQQCEAILRIRNVNLSLNDDEGVIKLNKNNSLFFDASNSSNTIWEMTIPTIKENWENPEEGE